MSDRRNPPEPGSPEYRWLYGDPADTGGKPAPGTKRPVRKPVSKPVGPLPPQPESGADETRVMPLPQASRPRNQPAPARADVPPRRPVTPPPGAARKPRRVRRWVLLVLVAWLAYLVVVPFLAMQQVEEMAAVPAGERPAEQDGTTYLVLGSDKADGLTPTQRRAIQAGKRSSARTDSIMLLHVGAGPDTLVSIPRDSLVPVPGHGTTKINAAYAYGGAPLLVQTLETITGVRVDHVVQIGFGGFVDVVDAVGGIEICPAKRMVDRDARLNIQKGCQEVDGITALAYARSRHAQALGDIDRAKHQREVVGAVGKKAVSPWSVLNPVRYWQLTHAGASTLTVSEGTGPIALGRFALALSSPDKSCGVPIADLAVHWDRERALQFFKLIKEDRTDEIVGDLCSESGLKK